MDGHGGKSKSGTNCHSLREVDLTSCWDVKDDSLSLLISGNASCLRSLTISNIYGVTDQVMMTISSSRARDNLTHLNISGCWRITEKGLRWVWWNGIILIFFWWGQAQTDILLSLSNQAVKWFWKHFIHSLFLPIHIHVSRFSLSPIPHCISFGWCFH